MFLNALSDKNISHSLFYTKNTAKVIIKLFVSKERLGEVSDITADFIIDNYSYKKAVAIIEKNYHFFSEEEKRDIIDRVFDKQERKKISALLYDYFMKNDRLYPDGFSAFRMKEFYECAEDSISMIVDEMLLNKEYLEFINMLKSFVSIHDSECDIINVYKPKHERYIMTDERGRFVVGDVGNVSFEIAQEEISVYDMLLSDLISISPKSVIIHNRDNFESQEILKTIEMVFEGKISYCDGCSHCDKYK